VVLAFGDHRLDIARRELRRGGELVALPPQAFDLLVFLVQHRDRVISKDDLLRGVWDGRIVSDSAITTRINAVRRALGDDGTAQRLVRTFLGRGVRFVGDVTELPDQTASISDRSSIAVLPFENLSADADQEYFVDGMVEEIITALSRFRRLVVIARNSTFSYRGRPIDVRQIGRELGARYVLEGSVRKAGNRVRIAGQLINTATGAHIWTDRFDGTLGDVFDLQDRVASSVVGAIEPQLRLAEIDRASRKPTESLEAHDLYLRALAQEYKRTKEGSAEAVRLLKCALELDPGYIPAVALISGCRTLQRSRHWIPTSGPEVDEAISFARQAITAGADDPAILTSAGHTLAFLAGENDTALSALDRAIVLNPNFALASGLRALVLVYLNRPDEAILAAQRAIQLSPRDPLTFLFVQATAFAHLAAGRHEAEMPWADEALRLNGGLPALRFKLSFCGHLGRLDDAQQCLRRLRELHPDPTVSSVMRDVSRGVAPEIVAHMAEGLRKAGVPDG
jgi:TolB-like protein